MLIINKKEKLLNNPFLLFSPFLLFFIILAVSSPTDGLSGDQGRYLQYARNLVHGFYADPSRQIYLDNGPGYPIFLMPFVALRLPLICITLSHAILHYLSIVLLFKVIKQIASLRVTLLCSFFWAFYFHAYSAIPFIYSEVFASFLITLLLYCLVKAFKSENPSTVKKYLIFSGIIVGYIALTKNIFGYVLMALIISAVILWLKNRKTVNYRKCMVVLGVALITTMPYLAYSYSFSKRVFFWGSLGGNNLYWMTTPYEEEYGTWFQAYVPARPDSISEPYFLPGSGKSIRLNHQKDLEEIHKYKGIAQDDAWKRASFRNIREHPGKYLQNCFSNIGRILFEMPHSYMIQRPGNLLRLPLNGIIVVLLLFLVIPTLINWRKIFFPIRFLLFFVLLYLGASTLACAESRMFTLVVPLWLLFIAYMLPRTVTIKFRFGEADKKTN